MPRLILFIKVGYLLTTKLYKQILKNKLKRGGELTNDTNIESCFNNVIINFFFNNNKTYSGSWDTVSDTYDEFFFIYFLLC